MSKHVQAIVTTLTIVTISRNTRLVVSDKQTASSMASPPPSPDADRRFRELYARPPDFKALSRLDPDFAAVPNRHNYILWLKDLLDTSSYSKPGRELTGLDIGTGASCIYPLLGCVQRPWSFIATDIDDESLRFARNNVERNGLSGRIRLVARSPGDPLIPLDELGIASIDFAMTNPPFYESEEQLLRSAQRKRRPPWTACTGAKTEMVTPGGEAAFVDAMFAESLRLRGRVQWYTAMLGFLSSLAGFVDKLRGAGVGNYAVTEFVQGAKTRRWGVAWSFAAMRPAGHAARGTRAALLSRNLLPAASEAEMEVPRAGAGAETEAAEDRARVVAALSARLAAAMAALDLLSWEWDDAALEGVGRAPDKVWARAWRRRTKRGRDGAPAQGGPAGAFGFAVWIRASAARASLGCRWLEGFDPAVFESFQGFLRRVVEGA
ncbi:hypothetical protein UVI_02038650 [Ustilaginoidea virens]|uniref:DUF890 domain-containing protein n=1 Tax=Ustilaginoidea virens TaxID=1159556 RepID=A0A1B5L2T9_USTVR|nr:hypothetical protein UVI_02038650 [Ustilaginoidea virens]